MSDSGNKDLISRLEAIDLAFTGHWSSSITLRCGMFYFNRELPNDLFFNKLTCVSYLDEKSLQESLGFFKKFSTTPYVYILNRPDLEEYLLTQDFRLYDTQHVLVKVLNGTRTSKARRISSDESNVWSKIFCSAYDCVEWMDSVGKIVKKSSDSIEYYVDESMSSCVALYEDDSILGLYCLGTIHEMRHRGLAASLIDFSLSEVKRRGLEYLMLATYGKDGLLDFYFKLGFREIYKKNVYTI